MRDAWMPRHRNSHSPLYSISFFSHLNVAWRLSQHSTPHLNHLIRDTVIFAVSKGKIHVLEALRRSSLEEVVDGSIDDNTLARTVDCEATDLDAVLAGDVLDKRRLADDLDELLACIAVLVKIADIAGSHGAIEWDGDSVLCRVSIVTLL